MDEPTNGLDPSGIHEMRELIKSLPRQFGMTVMVSSHLLSEIEQTADHIGIISSGQLIFQDTLHILRSRNVRQIHLRTSNDEGAAALLKEQIEVPGPASLSYSPEQGILIPFCLKLSCAGCSAGFGKTELICTALRSVRKVWRISTLEW